MMYHIPGVLSAQDVAWFRKQLDAAGWVNSRVITGARGVQIKNNQQVSTQGERYGVLQQAIRTAINNGALFFAAALPKTLSTPLFNRYQDNETYGLRVNGAVRDHPQSGWMRTNLSATLFLSNPNDYEGGELPVNDTHGQHAVKLPAGDLVLYPSSSLHCVTPVTHDVRITSFIWTRPMIRDDENRTMLFELDKDVQSLKTRYGESCEILSLLNLYHNLLREWFEI